MNSYRIEFTKQALKSLKQLDKPTKNRIAKHLMILSENPRSPELDVKKLQGFVNSFRLRIGDYRVIYSVKDDILLINIIRIGPRGNVYKS